VLRPLDAGQQVIVDDEELHLGEVRRLLHEHPVLVGARDKDIVSELQRLRDEVHTAKDEDKGAILSQYDNLFRVLEQLRKGRQTEEVDPDSPYFAHLRLREEGRTRDLFLGKATRIDHGLRIVDWRNAPISRIYYLYREADEYEEQLGDRVREGRVDARRTVSVSRGELRRVSAPQGSFVRGPTGWHKLRDDEPRLAGGEASSFHMHLQATGGRRRLGSGADLRPDKHLPDIAALIDPEQFELITRPESGLVVVRGGAGSGKTTVALHRVAYLAFQDPKRFRGERMRVLVWGRALRDYISYVLPSLGVHEVPVQTFSSWASMLVQRHFPFLPKKVAQDTPEAVSRIKLHPVMLDLTERRVAHHGHDRNARGAFDDWCNLFDKPEPLFAELAELAPGAFSADECEKICTWHRNQKRLLVNWIEGEKEEGAEVDAEDGALLLRLHQLRVGKLHGRRSKRPLDYTHLVVDEVQDLAPVELSVILDTLDKRRSGTLAGDTQQHVVEQSGFTSWNDLFERLGLPAKKLSTLRVSYRSTRQIMSFARGVLGELAEDETLPRALREGDPVELFRFTDHGGVVAFLADSLGELMTREKWASVAVITPHPSLSRMYADGLRRAHVPSVRLVEDQEFEFKPGVQVTEVNEVKGLEFDYVVLVETSARYYPDHEHSRRLLHVGTTRAAHQLWCTSVGSVSPLFSSSEIVG